MVKVCHMTSAHDSNDTRIFYKECTSLAANGYDTYLVARGESREENGVHIIGVGSAPSNRIQRMTSFARKVYQEAMELDCDIYHFHDPELLPYGLKLKKHGKKVIFDSHENTLEQMDQKAWIPVPFRKTAAKVYRAYASYVFKNLDGLISVTPHIVEQLKVINPNTCMVTNYPVYVKYPEKSKEVETATLCFTGGIDRQWSHELIVESLASLPNVKYKLCGPISENYLKQLKSSAGWERVEFYGKVPFERAAAIQQESTIGVALLQPSNNTGGKIGTIGNTKIFEYMMAGLPIVCTDFDLWKDIINRWNCGICVSPDNREDIINAVSFLIDHPDTAKLMGNNGRRAVAREFNWETQEEKLLQMYRAMVNDW